MWIKINPTDMPLHFLDHLKAVTTRTTSPTTDHRQANSNSGALLPLTSNKVDNLAIISNLAMAQANNHNVSR